VGIVVCSERKLPEMVELKDVLVMWTREDHRIEFSWHLADALIVVDSKNVEEVMRRCALVT